MLTNRILGTLFLMTAPLALADINLRVADLKLPDAKLESCIKKYASEQHYNTIAEVKEIPCYGLGVVSVQGLENFTEAMVIDLSVNDIRDFTPLFGLTKNLGYIDIHDNPIECSDMVDLSQKLRQAFRVGFDPSKCLKGGQKQPETPTPPAAPVPAPTPDSTTGVISVPTYQEVAPAVASACGSCHQNGKHKHGVSLDTEADLWRFGAASLSEIERGSMPPDEPEWQSSKEGLLVISYFKDQMAKGSIPTKVGHGEDDDDHHEHRRHRGHRDDD